MRGFVPARRVTFVSAKVTKTIFACARPLRSCSEAGLRGPSASAPNKMVRELALLKQPSPKGSIRGSGSAAPNAGEQKARKT